MRFHWKRFSSAIILLFFFFLPKNMINGNLTTILNHGSDLMCGSHALECWSRKITCFCSPTLLLYIPGLSTIDSFNMREQDTSIMCKPLLFWVFCFRWQDQNLIMIKKIHAVSYSVKARRINKLIGLKHVNRFANLWNLNNVLRNIKRSNTSSANKHMGTQLFLLVKNV